MSDSPHIPGAVLIGGAFAAAVVGAIVYGALDWTPVAIDPELSSKGTSFLVSYVFIIAAAERAAAVIVGLRRDPEKRTWESRVKRVSSLLNVEDQSTLERHKLERSYLREKTIIDPLAANGTIIPIKGVEADHATSEDYVGYLASCLDVYRFQLAAHNAQTNNYVTRVVFGGGVLVALAGLSIFEDILLNVDALGGGQALLVRGVDILVTGGLIGGGSKGFNSFLTTVDQYIRNTPA